MTKETIRDRNIRLLIEKGYQKVTKYPSRKYIVFRDHRTHDKLIFLGSHSGVRYGQTIGASYSTTINQFL